MELEHPMADRFAHALDLALASFVDGYLDHTRSLLARNHLHRRRTCRPIVKNDAFTQPKRFSFAHLTGDDRPIRLPHFTRRVEKGIAELPVGSEEEQPGRVVVKAPYREQGWITIERNERGNAGAPAIIRHRGEITRRLVEHDHHIVLGQGEHRTVIGHFVDGGVDLAPHLRDDRPVDADPALFDKPLGCASAGHAGPRQVLLKAHSAHRARFRARLVIRHHRTPIHRS